MMYRPASSSRSLWQMPTRRLARSTSSGARSGTGSSLTWQRSLPMNWRAFMITSSAGALSVRVADEPDAQRRLVRLVGQQVRRRGLEADGVAGAQVDDVEADRDLEFAFEQVAELRPVVLQHPAVVRRRRVRWIDDSHEVGVGARVGGQLLP